MEKRIKPDEIIDLLGLIPLEDEGGMFCVTYRSAATLNDKSISGGIYYLLSGRAFSHMHRLPTDEIYHHYCGDAVEMLFLMPNGIGEIVTLGKDLAAGHRPQLLMPAGCWHGSRLVRGGEYALMGTTMSPAFSSGDYEHGNAADLKKQYPQFSHMIDELTGDVIYR